MEPNGLNCTKSGQKLAKASKSGQKLAKKGKKQEKMAKMGDDGKNGQ